MQEVCIDLPPRDKQTPSFLQDPELRRPRFISIYTLVRAALPTPLFVQIQHYWRAQTHRRNERVVRGTVLVRHDTLAGTVLVDQDVVWRAVRGLGEDAEGLEAGRDDRVDEPRRQRGGQQRVGLGQRGGPGLEAAVGELGPAGEGGGQDLWC